MRNLKILFCLSVILFVSSSASGKTWFISKFDYANLNFLSLSYQNKDFKQKENLNLFDNYPPNVHRLTLSQSVIFADCGEIAERCSENKETIEVWAETLYGENAALQYNYTISGGKIIGKGEKVVWDLSDAEPGEYTITAGVDDGCGVCGQTKTGKVYIVKCPETVSGDITPGFISSLKLSQNEMFSSCNLSKYAKFDPSNACLGKKSMILVVTNAYKANDANAIFKYEVTDGQIVGNGDDVYWDLSQAKPGTHVITASIDAGRGFCTNWVSDSVEVAECPKCKK